MEPMGRSGAVAEKDQMGVMHPDTIGTVTFLARIAQDEPACFRVPFFVGLALPCRRVFGHFKPWLQTDRQRSP